MSFPFIVMTKYRIQNINKFQQVKFRTFSVPQEVIFKNQKTLNIEDGWGIVLHYNQPSQNPPLGLA